MKISPLKLLWTEVAQFGEANRQVTPRRLHNVRVYLNAVHGIADDRIITAEGDKTADLGRLDIYVGGRLIAVFSLKRNEDIVLGGTKDCDGSKDLFYPSRARKSR